MENKEMTIPPGTVIEYRTSEELADIQRQIAADRLRASDMSDITVSREHHCLASCYDPGRKLTELWLLGEHIILTDEEVMSMNYVERGMVGYVQRMIDVLTRAIQSFKEVRHDEAQRKEEAKA